MTQIKFGTSGWRGILAEDFTLENVRIVTQAIADFLLAGHGSDKGVVIGHDSRFFGERFARESARVLAGSKVPSFICRRDTPTTRWLATNWLVSLIEPGYRPTT